MKYLYMAVTPDKYELPLVVTETLRELSFILGTKENNLSSSLSRKRSGKKKGYKIVKVKMEEI